jgi:hypothetical protein
MLPMAAAGATNGSRRCYQATATGAAARGHQLRYERAPTLLQAPIGVATATSYRLRCKRSVPLLQSPVALATSSMGGCYERRQRLLRAASAAATSGGGACYKRHRAAATSGSGSCDERRWRFLRAAAMVATNRPTMLQGSRWCCYVWPVAVLRPSDGYAASYRWRCYQRLAGDATTVLPAWSTPATSLTGAGRQGWLVWPGW